MYETDELPGGLTHDDVDRIERAAGVGEPTTTGAAGLDELLADSTLVGSPLGRSGHPGPGWNRPLWSELARRLDVDPFAIDAPPCHRSFPYTSWPASIRPPAEGSLDREQFLRLVDCLAAVTPAGGSAPCVAFYALYASGELDEPVAYEGRLQDLVALYDDEDGSPSNVWPRDESWFVYTDWDLWATKVSGSADLIDRLIRDGELEAVLLFP